ncbi:MAG: tRNA 2-thiouridine(34) synthase MnmA [Candidatus Staskawiczbacteria bacterium]|nr:tRNA 2-thiouridine(34) synthase MnmA [Candidatus Staskawiczbacteria bacterium]
MKSTKNKKLIRVVVGMSGGVDSSVAAALLKQTGFDVVGVFMKFWKDGKSSDNRCCSVESEKLARLVAKEIGIPFYVLNVEKEFKKKVVDYFLAEYKKGKTPNPCVVCNKEIKFGFLINKALSLGADFVATGHYAQISLSRSATNFFPSAGKPPLPLRASGPGTAKSSLPRFKNLLPRLLKGEDKNKDQSYFLWQLSQEQLSHVLFPIGGYTKPEVRKLAKKFKLPTAETPESQEVCFVQDTTNNFLKKYLKAKPGPVIEQAQNGVKKIIGQHNGLWFYTIGQRRGLEIQQGPWFVVNKDFKKNILVVSKNQKDLERKELVAGDINWITLQKLPLSVEVKIRYKSAFAKAKISSLGKNKIKVIFLKKQRAITPGQSVVFYKKEELLGGGIIE